MPGSKHFLKVFKVSSQTPHVYVVEGLASLLPEHVRYQEP